MEFSEKLQQLRKQKNMTQEELAEALYVSRTAVSKWESGRGCPSIDSLKAIAKFFSVSIDELLSGEELLAVSEKDSLQKISHLRDLVFGLLDCAVAMFLFLPFFGQYINNKITTVGLLTYTDSPMYMIVTYFSIVLLTILWGIGQLALQNWQNTVWLKIKSSTSLILSTFGALMFMASRQPYVALFTFIFLIIKGSLVIKMP